MTLSAASTRAGDEPAGKPALKPALTPDGKPEETPAAKPEGISILQRVTRFAAGEPQVTDASEFYRKLRERLDQTQPLGAEALADLGKQRAAAVVAALTEAGVDPSRVSAGAPEKVEAAPGKAVPLRLALAGK